MAEPMWTTMAKFGRQLRLAAGAQPLSVDGHERVRASIGALLGIALSAFGGLAVMGSEGVWLVAPMGASAVLMFAVPSSPLAQPWPALAGNVVSAAIGIGVVKLIGVSAGSAALAVALALAAMFPLRCVHPPGGAAALVAVLGGPAVQALGWQFPIAPVGLNTLLLVAAALLFHRVTRPRPVPAPRPATRPDTADHTPQERLGFTPADLDVAMRSFNQLLDVDRVTLEELLRQAEAQAWQRRAGQVRCGDFMSRDVVAVAYGTPLTEAWQLMRKRRVHALPVIDRARRVQGIVTQADFVRLAMPESEVDPRTLGARLRALLQPSGRSHSERPEAVGQIMSHPVHAATDDEPLANLVPRLSDLGLHQLPVVNAQGRLVGMVSQSDLVAALYHAGTAA